MAVITESGQVPRLTRQEQPGGPESDNLFVTDMPVGMTDDLISQILGQYGTVVSVRNCSKEGQSWSAALVRYASVEEAKYVQESLNGNIPQGLESPITVRFANPHGVGKGGGGGFGKAPAAGGPGATVDRYTPYGNGRGPSPAPAGKGGSGVSMDDIVGALEATGQLPGGATFVNDEGCIFIVGLPRDCTDLHLYRIFSPFGPIYPQGVKACTTGKGGGGTCRGYGFVNFTATESAHAAILTLNGAILPDGTTLRVSIKTEGAKKDRQPLAQEPATM